MAEMPKTIRMRVEVEDEALKQLNESINGFNKAANEIYEATMKVRDAVNNLHHSFEVVRVKDGD